MGKRPTLADAIEHAKKRLRKPAGHEMSESGRRWVPATLVRVDYLRVLIKAAEAAGGE